MRASLILFETAPRLVTALGDLRAVLGDRPAAVARELTKMFEEVRRGSLQELLDHYMEAGPPEGRDRHRHRPAHSRCRSQCGNARHGAAQGAEGDAGERGGRGGGSRHGLAQAPGLSAGA